MYSLRALDQETLPSTYWKEVLEGQVNHRMRYALFSSLLCQYLIVDLFKVRLLPQ
jgi:hypothetical protein